MSDEPITTTMQANGSITGLSAIRTNEEQEIAPTKNLMAAMLKAQAAMEPAKKTSTNPHFKSSYADLTTVLDAIGKPARDNGLVVTQWPLSNTLLTRIDHPESGEFMINALEFPEQSSAQSYGSWLTYTKRYSLASIFCLPQEDDDGSTAEKGAKKPAAKPEPKQQPKTPTVPDTKEGKAYIAAYDKLKLEFRTFAPGTGKADIQLKKDLMQSLFGVTSWEAAVATGGDIAGKAKELDEKAGWLRAARVMFEMSSAEVRQIQRKNISQLMESAAETIDQQKANDPDDTPF